MADEQMGEVVHDLIDKMREPLGLSLWTIRPLFGPDPDGNKAACEAMWEYADASISLDPDAIETLDDLPETIAHEMGHCHLAPIASFADDCLVALLELLPEEVRPVYDRLWRKQLDKAEEWSMTQIGHTYNRLLRRCWAAEASLAEAKKEVRALERAAKERGDTVK